MSEKVKDYKIPESSYNTTLDGYTGFYLKNTEAADNMMWLKLDRLILYCLFYTQLVSESGHWPSKFLQKVSFLWKKY